MARGFWRNSSDSWIAAGGANYELIPPVGYRIDYDRLAIIDSDGEIIAVAGDAVMARGFVDRDAMSVCQIGPIFRADAIRRV